MVDFKHSVLYHMLKALVVEGQNTYTVPELDYEEATVDCLGGIDDDAIFDVDDDVRHMDDLDVDYDSDEGVT